MAVLLTSGQKILDHIGSGSNNLGIKNLTI